MRKITLKITSIFLGLFFVFPQITKAEIIQNFYSEINVLPDSSLIINERITYDFEKSLRVGIYRDIPLSNKAGKNIVVNVISVTDDNAEPYKFSTTTKYQVPVVQLDYSLVSVKFYLQIHCKRSLFGGLL